MESNPLEQNSYSLQKYSETRFKIIHSSLRLDKAISLMQQDQISCLLIESQLKLIGILTEKNLVELIASKKNFSLLRVEQVMTQNPIVLNVETNVSPAEIASLFQRHSISYLPLVNKSGGGVGIITPSSILDNLNFQEVNNAIESLENESDRKTKQLTLEKKVEYRQQQQLEIEYLKSQNQKLKFKNWFLEQEFKKEKPFVKQVYSSDRIQDREGSFQSLEQDSTFLETVLQQMPGGVILAEASSGRCLLTNDLLTEIFRRTTVPINIFKEYLYFGLLEEDHSLSLLENSPLVKALENKPIQGEEMKFLCGDEIIRTFFVNSAPIYNSQGLIVAAIATFYDINDVKQAQLVKQETTNRSIFLKETHHRIKNNLQVISALLDLQSEQVQDEAAYSLLEKSQARIQTMALIYEKVFNSGNIERIDFTDYVTSLTRYLYDSFIEDYKYIELDLKIEPIKLSIDLATPCGLIINELVTNSLQHGFKNRDRGSITINFFLDQKNQYNLQIADNGSGINPQVYIDNNPEFLGISMVKSLVIEQLKGNWHSFSRNGCVIEITFPSNGNINNLKETD